MIELVVIHYGEQGGYLSGLSYLRVRDSEGRAHEPNWSVVDTVAEDDARFKDNPNTFENGAPYRVPLIVEVPQGTTPVALELDDGRVVAEIPTDA